MKLPRDLGGEDLVKKLEKYGYKVTRQTGSLLRLSTTMKGVHHITISRHNVLRVGTLNNILKDIANHLEITKEDLIKEI